MLTEGRHAEAESFGGSRHTEIRGRQHADANALRDREMQGVEGSQREVPQSFQQRESCERVAVSDRFHMEMTGSDVALETSRRHMRLLRSTWEGIGSRPRIGSRRQGEHWLEEGGVTVKV